MSITTPKPYLGRCKQAGCDYALFANADQIQSCEDWKGVVKGGAPMRVGNNGVFARCTNGHKVFMLRQIKGTYSEDHKCDSRCLNAKGHECTCSCGGLNHGRGYAIEHVHHADETIDHDIANHPAAKGLDPNSPLARSIVANNQVIAARESADPEAVVKMISEGQIRFVRTLLEERDIPAKDGQTSDERRAAGIEKVPTLTAHQARMTIDWLKTLPRREYI
jgi:hypothetical protein